MTCKLVAYVRVSTKGQARDGQGLGIQRRDVERFAKRNHHQLVAICADEGVTGTLPAEQRPGLLDALRMIRRKDATALVVPSLDRLGRTLTVQEAALALVWDAGADVYSVDEGLVLQDDPEDPMRTAIRQMRGVMHQLDKALIAKRLRNGRQAKRDAGEFAGGTVSYGMRLVDGKLIKNSEEQRVIRLVRRLRTRGMSLRAIGEELDRQGLQTRAGGAWHPWTLRQLDERGDG